MSEQLELKAIAKMQKAGMGEAEISSFVRALRRLIAGEKAFFPESDIAPLDDLDRLADLGDFSGESEALSKTAVLKLNGGIGTTMGLRGPKSLLEAHGGRTFLDIAITQVKKLREQYGVELPFILLNSGATEEQTAQALVGKGVEVDGIPVSVLQSIVPRLNAQTLEPVEWPANPSLEWAPPGHGDL